MVLGCGKAVPRHVPAAVAESMGVHVWESEVLTKAFLKVTGIKVTEDIIDEGSVIERIYTQMACRASPSTRRM